MLRDYEGVALAVLTISDIWMPNKVNEAEQVYGTQDTVHPAVDYLLNQSGFLKSTVIEYSMLKI